MGSVITKNQIIVAIETSTIACSAAVLILSSASRDDVLIYELYKEAPRQHTDLILPMLDEVLQQAGYQLSDVDVLAFGCGPGAFTGVRIASSVIQAISYATKIKVISISSLAALAQGQYRRKHAPKGINHFIVASDARMNEVYLGCYQHNGEKLTLIGEEKLLKPNVIGKNIQDFCKNKPIWYALGSGWSEYQAIIDKQIEAMPYKEKISTCLPHAQDIAFLAIDKLANQQFGEAQTALPVYLRNNVAVKSSKQVQ